nr:sorting nexin 2A-like [Ziziphus jujuba var. spinosa]
MARGNVAANGGFQTDQCLLTVQTLSADLVSCNLGLRSLKLPHRKNLVEIDQGAQNRGLTPPPQETARVTEDAKSCAVREYERIKDNNRDELERFDKERHIDFMDMLKGFVLNQAGYAEKMANAWENLAEETIRYARDGS